MTCDGEAHWYLSVKYTREASGAVSAHTSQELYINKILKRWGMESCKPLPTPFPAKSDVVLDELLKPIENPEPFLNKQFQEIIGPSYGARQEGALALVNNRICLVTSMATPALLISNLNDFQAWAMS